LEKNAQALNKSTQQKGAGKAGQSSTNAAAAQQFHVSPHGNPSYIGKAKDMNLQLPPSRKRQKTNNASASQTPQSSQASPQASKKVASPEAQRTPGAQAAPPPKPVLLCKERDCQQSIAAYATEQALRQHIQEEHIRPKEDPIKFVQENLALVLGLEPDGSPKADQNAGEAAPSMSASTSRQGTAAGAATAMVKAGSAMGKQSEQKLSGQAGGAASGNAWANASIDPTALLQTLGYQKGIPGIVNDLSAFRSLTPQDTPESTKDSGDSEPNSDISDGAALDIDLNWQNLDTDLLVDLNNTSLESGLSALDASSTTLDPLFLINTSGPLGDWDDLDADFSKPFELDTSLYHMQTS
jgi:hypothetical protein